MSDLEGPRLKPVEYADLRGWAIDDPRPLLPAMRACLAYLEQGKPYRTGGLGLTVEDLLPLLRKAEEYFPQSAAEARQFFEAFCQPFQILRDDGGRGFVTAFYEPEVEVRAKRESGYEYPFYNRPADLIDLDGSNRPHSIDPSYAFARKIGDTIDLYPDRKAIDQGYLAGRGLEIAWARSKVDVFFAHVQGAARLIYPDSAVRRITYSAKAGHPFSPIGRYLIDQGEIPAAQISMQSIRAWLAAHPDRVDEVLWHNRSYIFFREADVSDPALGPVAAAKVPLVPGRALAVDRQIHTFGFPFFIRSDSLTHLDEGREFARLMLALDTGSAIIGPARGDIFTGSGSQAGELAGTVRNAADFYLLIPRQSAARFLP